MSADDDMPKVSGGFRPCQKERRRLLGPVANDEPVAVNPDRRPGAAYRDHAILNNGVIRIVGVHARASAYGATWDDDRKNAGNLFVSGAHQAGSDIPRAAARLP
jgi:hypothetical protein